MGRANRNDPLLSAVASDVDKLYKNYVVSKYESQGAEVRLLMNALPALLLLIWRPKFRFAKSEAPLWTWFAIVSLVLLALFMSCACQYRIGSDGALHAPTAVGGVRAPARCIGRER